jgi:hypothetical protein
MGFRLGVRVWRRRNQPCCHTIRATSCCHGTVPSRVSVSVKYNWTHVAYPVIRGMLYVYTVVEWCDGSELRWVSEFLLSKMKWTIVKSHHFFLSSHIPGNVHDAQWRGDIDRRDVRKWRHHRVKCESICCWKSGKVTSLEFQKASSRMWGCSTEYVVQAAVLNALCTKWAASICGSAFNPPQMSDGMSCPWTNMIFVIANNYANVKIFFIAIMSIKLSCASLSKSILMLISYQYQWFSDEYWQWSRQISKFQKNERLMAIFKITNLLYVISVMLNQSLAVTKVALHTSIASLY